MPLSFNILAKNLELGLPTPGAMDWNWAAKQEVSGR